jgi:hypothetical protein
MGSHFQWQSRGHKRLSWWCSVVQFACTSPVCIKFRLSCRAARPVSQRQDTSTATVRPSQQQTCSWACLVGSGGAFVYRKGDGCLLFYNHVCVLGPARAAHPCTCAVWMRSVRR